jgi:predicted ABC-type ATPase
MWIHPDDYFTPLTNYGRNPIEYSLENNGMMDRERVDAVKKLMQEKQPLDAVWYDIDITTGKVTNQEGRHRAYAAYELGINRIPLIIYFRNSEGKAVDLKNYDPQVIVEKNPFKWYIENTENRHVSIINKELRYKGGAGSGHHGHKGRPGEVGGSVKRGTLSSDSSNSSKKFLTDFVDKVSNMQENSIYGVVKRHGKFYTPKELPKKYKLGKPKLCYMNAYYLASAHDELQYVEGLAIPDFADIPIEHAWCVDKNGNVVDNTWKPAGNVYYGVPFEDEFISSVLVETGMFGVITYQSKAFRDKYAVGDLRNKELDMKYMIRLKGGEGSGHHGHKGIPGHHGGSLPRGSSAAVGKLSTNKGKFTGEMVNPNGLDTLEQYRNPDGTWTKERQALHDKIKKKFFEGKTPVKDPVSYILGGGPASGKTTIVKSGMVKVPENTVLASGDDVKQMLPEYEFGDPKDPNRAPFVHEESSYLAKEIMTKASDNGYNVLMDGTGDGGIKSVLSKVEKLSKNGQPVKGIYVTVDVETAVARSISRAKKTNRYMPESVLRENHAAVSRVFEDIVKFSGMSSIELYDTNSNIPKLIASAVGTELKILDADAYASFISKGRY